MLSKVTPSPHSAAKEIISTEARRMSMASSSRSSPGQKGSYQEPRSPCLMNALNDPCTASRLLRLQEFRGGGGASKMFLNPEQKKKRFLHHFVKLQN